MQKETEIDTKTNIFGWLVIFIMLMAETLAGLIFTLVTTGSF